MLNRMVIAGKTDLQPRNDDEKVSHKALEATIAQHAQSHNTHNRTIRTNRVFLYLFRKDVAVEYSGCTCNRAQQALNLIRLAMIFLLLLRLRRL